jgi:hypothetical protein
MGDMRLTFAFGVIAVVLVAIAAAVAGTARLEVSAKAPFTVHGVGFAPGERVTVMAQAAGRYVKVVTAGEDGTFTVRFDVSLGICPAYIVRATGSRGSHASVRLVRECAYPVSPP